MLIEVSTPMMMLSCDEANRVTKAKNRFSHSFFPPTTHNIQHRIDRRTDLASYQQLVLNISSSSSSLDNTTNN